MCGADVGVPGRGLISFVDGWRQKAVFLWVFLRP